MMPGLDESRIDYELDSSQMKNMNINEGKTIIEINNIENQKIPIEDYMEKEFKDENQIKDEKKTATDYF